MTRVNLLRPRLPSRQSGARKRVIYLGTALVLLFVTSVGAHLWALAGQQLATESLGFVEVQLDAEVTRIDEWQALRKEIDRLEEREAVLDQIPPAQDGFSALAGAIRTAAEPGCRVDSIMLDPDGGLILTGSAGSHGAVADYVDRLRTVPGVVRMELQSSVRSAADGLVAFDLRGTMGGRLE